MTTFNKLTTNKKVVRIFSISAFSLMLAACSQTNPARIQDLSGTSSSTSSTTTTSASTSVTSGSTSSTYNRPPANITTAKVNNTSSSTTVKQGGGNVVTTTQERIVYNRNYDDIPKGGYNGNTYTVKRGDTLFYIAWITGNDFRSLAAKNNIQAPYDLNVGQVLDVTGGTTVVVTKETTMPKTGTATKPTTKTTTTTTTTSTPTNSSTQPTTKVTTTTSTSSVAQTASSNVANIVWQWPAQGKIIESFSNATKGIDIAGSLGDKIVAAADGKVVYAGNALPGYGNLIIIKHNDDYLTAYAHNQSILVKEQQEVRAGQQIATMGSTGTSSVRLHFEIRYQAKSVDPLKYLPKR